nr:hypothetical protein CFP56_68584 [Quercus suber]
MKQSFCTQLWDSSPEIVKKLFKLIYAPSRLMSLLNRFMARIPCYLEKFMWPFSSFLYLMSKQRFVMDILPHI